MYECWVDITILEIKFKSLNFKATWTSCSQMRYC